VQGTSEDDEKRNERTYERARARVASLVRAYAKTNPLMKRCMEEIARASARGGDENDERRREMDVIRELPLDHIAFRSIKTKDCGLDELRAMFEELGYETKEETMRFEAKKVRARWLAPPRAPKGKMELPRVFLSEFLMEDCEDELRRLVEDVLERVGRGDSHLNSAEASIGRVARWQLPTASEYAKIEKLSEYASWTLLHGYAVNHVAVSVFQLCKMYPETQVKDLDAVRACLESNASTARAKWNLSGGGMIKLSPDGLLAQSSLMAEPCKIPLHKSRVTSSDKFGLAKREDFYKEYMLPGSYLEFVVRLPTPENKNKPFEELVEADLRDGFETSNADKIFDSTSAALHRRTTLDGSGSAAVANGSGAPVASRASIAGEAPVAGEVPVASAAPVADEAPVEGGAPVQEASSYGTGSGAPLSSSLLARFKRFIGVSSVKADAPAGVQEDEEMHESEEMKEDEEMKPAADHDVIDLTL